MGERYYQVGEPRFRDFFWPAEDGWRKAQVGALASCIAHSTTSEQPGVVVMPTGTGKTAVETALPHLFASHRVLILVPTVELRRQVAESFESQATLRSVTALDGQANPDVLEVTGVQHRTEALEHADVVVAIPQTLVAYLEFDTPISADLFDLVLIDEAHHAASNTWSRVIDYFECPRTFLFTATPHRRDGMPLPGLRIYSYSVRDAIAAGLLNRIESRILSTNKHKDEAIVEEVVTLVNTADYTGAPVLARTDSIARAEGIAELYRNAGIQVTTYHSDLSVEARRTRMDSWRRRDIQVLVGVNAISEGIDFPDLRVLAYHDKHKSDPATMQQIGRLARPSPKFAVASVVIAVEGGDEFEALKGAVRGLYSQDADWAKLIPSLVDGEVSAARDLLDFTDGFSGDTDHINLANIHPLSSVELREVVPWSTFVPAFAAKGELPRGLGVGQRVAGHRITLSRWSSEHGVLVLCFGSWQHPKWGNDPALTSLQSDLCVVTWHPGSEDSQSSLLAISATDGNIRNSILNLLGAATVVRLPEIERLQEVLETQPRISVSNFGARSTSGTPRGVAQYSNHSGRDVDRDTSTSSMGFRALGHVMVQLEGKINAGIAAEKGKYWEIRYPTLPEYVEWVKGVVAKYRNPAASTMSRLLPAFARGKRVDRYPDEAVICAELDPRLFQEGWQIFFTDESEEEACHLDDLRFHVTLNDGKAEIALYKPADESKNDPIWTGSQEPTTLVVSNTEALRVINSSQDVSDLATVLGDYPLTLWLRDGSTIRGTIQYARSAGSTLYNSDFVEAWTWPRDCQITNEAGSRKKPREKPWKRSIQCEVERHLKELYGNRENVWVFRNDGSGEIADHLVVGVNSDGTASLELWHSKGAGSNTPGLGHGQFQVLAEQGMKSRRAFVDPEVWSELALRLEGASKRGPQLHYVGGDLVENFKALVGLKPDGSETNFVLQPPLVRGEIVLVQPGLSANKFTELLTKSKRGEQQKLIDILAVARTTIQEVASFRIISSP